MVFSMSFFPNQGRYLRVYNEARSLLKAFGHVNIIAWDRECTQPKLEIVDGILVERIRIKTGVEKGPIRNGWKVLLFNLIVFLKLVLRRREVDIIHAFNIDTMISTITAAKLMGKGAILDLCEPDYYAFWDKKYAPFLKVINWLEKVISRRFDAVFVHNNYQVKKFQKYGVRHLEQIGTYPSSRLIVERIKIHRNSENKPVIIGRIGTIYANNGIEELVEAFKLLLNRFKHTRLLLAGRVYNNYQETFDRLMHFLGDKVEVTGPFSPEQIPELYRRIDISVMLNRRTDWFKNITPTKFFDSIANGVPVITSDIGDLREITEKFKCGLVVDETDPESICSALEILVNDPALRQKMAENGLRAAKEKYNWDLMEKRLLNVYDTLSELPPKSCTT